MYLAYSLALAAAFLLGTPYWLVQMLRRSKYHDGLAERLGRVPPRLRPVQGAVVWVHAVSVGEVLATSGLIEELKARFPGSRVVVSTTTTTGQRLARERFGAENVFYFPLDFAFAIRPYLRALKPSLVVLAETEFWPNFLRLARQSGARVAVVNARISDRSLPGYRRWRGLLTGILRNVKLFLAQSEEDRRRLIFIGAAPERVQVAGNLKFDTRTPALSSALDPLRAALAGAGREQTVVCGSTVEGEEELLLRAFEIVRTRHPQAVMVVAPRHPERFDAVAGLLAASGVPWQRRTALAAGESIAGGVLLLDSIGELSSVYAVGSVAFVGGSLVPRGGHNILEPAQQGCAILVGPHTENFRDIVRLFDRAGAVCVVRPDPQALADALLQLLGDRGARSHLGELARQTWQAQAGATQRTLDALAVLMDLRPSDPVGQPAPAPKLAEES
ncbi:MAG: 3-deoxy-D-manno-octulosonic acid transferase [Acidobacteriota bacterium]|nr:3-deoxy-D-manno-octulosonic acid transferase [Acidobacteriota bacterium]